MLSLQINILARELKSTKFFSTESVFLLLKSSDTHEVTVAGDSQLWLILPPHSSIVSSLPPFSPLTPPPFIPSFISPGFCLLLFLKT